MGSNLLNGLMSKDLTKFKSDYENSRHVASFNIIKTNESTHKHELSLCKIPVIKLNTIYIYYHFNIILVHK